MTYKQNDAILFYTKPLDLATFYYIEANTDY